MDAIAVKFWYWVSICFPHHGRAASSEATLGLEYVIRHEDLEFRELRQKKGISVHIRMRCFSQTLMILLGAPDCYEWSYCLANNGRINYPGWNES
jgi:hypothetical protein